MLAEGLTGENALLREQVARLAARDAERDAELEKLRADFAVLQRMLFGRSSEKSRPEPPGGGDAAQDKDATTRLEEAHAAWDAALAVIDEARKKQIQAPGLQEPAKKALATLGREWDDLANAAFIWTVTATAQMAGLNVLTYLTAYPGECGRNGGKPLAGQALECYLPWNASPEDLRTWAQPPPSG